jgi:hypothetical protein
MKMCSAMAFFVFLFLSAPLSFGQKIPKGIWEGYDGEWKHVSEQLIALAEATPLEKFAWRTATVDRMYLRIIVHANEQMGQLVAYARLCAYDRCRAAAVERVK